MNTKKPVILTDCDNVLVNWSANLPLFFKDRGLPYDHINGILEENVFVPHTALFKTKCHVTATQRMLEYNHSHYIRTLPVFEHAAVDVLLRISTLADIIVVTNLSDKPIAKENREFNLRLNYGDIFSDVVCLPPHADKSDAIAKIAAERNVLMYLDDRLLHVKEGKRANVPSYHYTHRMKKGINHGDSIEIPSWIDAEREIMKAI